MAEEVYELVARLTPEGAEETEEALQGAREEFEETTNTVEQSTDDLEGFSTRFQGAIGVAVTSLAVASGGLLSTVPIIGEQFAAIGALIDAVGLKIDGVLRPRLEGSTNQFYEWADAIDRAEGPLADFIGWAALIGSILGVVGSAALLAGIKIFGFSAVLGAATGALGTVAAAIGTVLGAILSIPGIVAIGILAVAAFTAAYLTNFMGVRDTTDEVWAAIVNTFKNAANSVVATFEGLFNTAVQAANDGMNNILRTIINGVNTAINQLNKIPGVNIGNVQFNPLDEPDRISFGRPFRTRRRSDPGVVPSSIRRRAGGDSTVEELLAVLRDLRDGQQTETPVTIDGRQVGRAVGGFGAVQTSNRGR